jgi:tRNA(fMet)-specific endonuclease VapC
MAQRVVVDSDILSAIFRGNASVVNRARDYLSEHGQFDISIISQYEILRGLKAKGATRQIERFEDFCARNRITLSHRI